MKALLLNITLGLQELLGNPLRTFLSVLGVSIGVFCIVSVSSVFDSMETNIQNNMASLGSDVLYVGKYAWMPEDSDEKYAWWRYKARPVIKNTELINLQNEAKYASYSAISYSSRARAKFQNQKVDNARMYAVTYDFNKLQPIDLKAGRYFSLGEIQSGLSNGVVIGSTLADDLFGSINPIDKEIKLDNKIFYVLGVIKKTGRMTTGFQFDNGAIISYNYFTSYTKIDQNTNNGSADPLLMIKARRSNKFEELKLETEGILRRTRGLKATEKNNFSFNQLSGIQDKVSEIFAMVRWVGWIIGAFSLIVGVFSVANIMFVSVKERTNLIGIKKAIGATNRAVLIEFLVESILLCLLGGAVGMLFTFLLTTILSNEFDFPIYININNVFFGVAVSVVVGLVAGIIPANRASKLDPVKAIRS